MEPEDGTRRWNQKMEPEDGTRRWNQKIEPEDGTRRRKEKMESEDEIRNQKSGTKNMESEANLLPAVELAGQLLLQPVFPFLLLVLQRGLKQPRLEPTFRER
jgi:hypothetical protein